MSRPSQSKNRSVMTASSTSPSPQAFAASRSRRFKGRETCGRMSNMDTPSRIQLETWWREALDPQGIGLCEAVADDIGAYTAEPRAEVLAKMREGVESFKQLWLTNKPDASNAEAVAEFYRDQFVEAYELADWH